MVFLFEFQQGISVVLVENGSYFRLRSSTFANAVLFSVIRYYPHILCICYGVNVEKSVDTGIFLYYKLKIKSLTVAYLVFTII